MKKITITIAASADSVVATPLDIKAQQKAFPGNSEQGAEACLRRDDMEAKQAGTVRDARALVAALRERGVNIETASVRFSPRAGSHECDETVDLLSAERGTGNAESGAGEAAGEKVGEGAGELLSAERGTRNAESVAEEAAGEQVGRAGAETAGAAKAGKGRGK